MEKNKKVVVTKIDKFSITFNDGTRLTSEHKQDCCEQHYLCFDDLTIIDFNDLEFDLLSDDLFEEIQGYGINLKPTNGFPIKIPGYGYNNGYYNSSLFLVLKNKNGFFKEVDISGCQTIQ